MNVNLDLKPEVERNLAARAHVRGVSLDDYLQELVTKEAGLPVLAVVVMARPKGRRAIERWM